MQVISNQTTQAQYANALTLGPDDFEAISVDVWNASTAMQIFTAPGGHYQQGDWADEIIVSPSTVTLQRCGGVRFRTNPGTPSTPALINAYAWRDGEPLITGGLQLLGTLAAGGGFTPPATGPIMVTGIVSGAGANLGGTGFTIVRNSTGNYTITYTNAFATTPTLLVTDSDGGQVHSWITVSAQAAGSFTVQAFNSNLTPVDMQFNFVALTTA